MTETDDLWDEIHDYMLEESYSVGEIIAEFGLVCNEADFLHTIKDKYSLILCKRCGLWMSSYAWRADDGLCSDCVDDSWL